MKHFPKSNYLINSLNLQDKKEKVDLCLVQENLYICNQNNIIMVRLT
jgi:hypothetical protein